MWLGGMATFLLNVANNNYERFLDGYSTDYASPHSVVTFLLYNTNNMRVN